MVKEKINSVRTYDEDGYRRRAACLCFKDESEQEVSEFWGSRWGNEFAFYKELCAFLTYLRFVLIDI